VASVEEVKAGLAQAADETGQGITGIRGVADMFDRAITRMRAVLAGSSAAQVSQAIAQLEQAKARLAESAQLASGSIASAREYAARI